MAKYQYQTTLYTWTPDDGKQDAYTLEGEIEANNYNAAQCQAYYDVLEQRIAPDAEISERTHIGKINVEQKDG